MDVIGHILQLADEYARVTGAAEVTVSWRMFNDSKKLGALRGGADIQMRRAERVIQEFSNRWPDGAAWPASLERPEPQASAA